MKHRFFKRIAAAALTAALLVGGAANVFASTTITNDVFIVQQYSNTCTLASATMMIRSRLKLANDPNWNVSEASVHKVGWAPGLYNSFSYSTLQNTVSVRCGYLSGSSSSRLAELKKQLDKHREGIVMYCYQGNSKSHAVFLTDYEGNTLYCADPAGGSYSKKRIKVANSYLKNYYGSQSNIVANANKYWYISSGPSIVTNVESSLRFVTASGDLPSGTLAKGRTHSIGGEVRSNYSITKLKGEIIDNSTKQTVQGITVKPNTNYYNIRNSSVDYGLKFAKLNSGQYFVKYTAWDASGKKVMCKGGVFTIK